MFRKVLETIGTRYVVALLNLALIFINARVLGLEGVGLAGLIIASMNIAILFNSLFSGNTIVYFMNQYPIRVVLLPAYLWAPVGSLIACLLMYFLGMLPEGYFADVFWLAILNSFVAANSRMLLGKDQVKGFNLTFFFQGGLLFFLLAYLYYYCNERNVEAYILGMYIANGIALIASFILLFPYLRGKEKRTDGESAWQIIKKMLSYGLWSSADNLAEIFTTRLNYFLVKSLSGLSSVGLLDAGTKISESVWHISRSVSLIEYSEVAKEKDAAIQKQITLRLFKFALLALSALMFVIALIPEWVYTDYLFTPEFKGMRLVVLMLAPGIIAFGCNNVLGHYFIGAGKIRYSAYSSFTGLVVLLLSGYWLISKYGIMGSAISSSIAFLSMLTFSLVMFSKHTLTCFREYLPGKQDFSFVVNKVKEQIRSIRDKN